MIWEYNGLWNKAKLYFQRGFAESPESPLFPFWLSLGLELLGRATLAKIHPCLLADPQEGENLLYACGFSISKRPKSVQAKTVFHRCTAIIPELTEDHFKFIMALMDRRNAELHSGELSFEAYPNKLWLPDYFHICEILVAHQKKTLEDIFEAEVAKTARSSIQAFTSKRKSIVMKLIAGAKKTFESLEISARRAKLSEAETKVKSTLVHNSREIICPSCGAKAIVTGETARYLEPRAEHEAIVDTAVILPTNLICYSCGLSLTSHEDLLAAGFGDQFTFEYEMNPKDYYGIEFDPGDYFEPDYGND